MLGRSRNTAILLVMLDMAGQSYRVEMIRVVVAHKKQIDLVKRCEGCFQFLPPWHGYDFIGTDTFAKETVDQYLPIPQGNQEPLIRNLSNLDRIGVLCEGFKAR